MDGGRGFLLILNGESVANQHLTSGSTMFAPTVTMDQISTLKIARYCRWFKVSPIFKGCFKWWNGKPRTCFMQGEPLVRIWNLRHHRRMTTWHISMVIGREMGPRLFQVFPGWWNIIPDSWMESERSSFILAPIQHVTVKLALRSRSSPFFNKSPYKKRCLQTKKWIWRLQSLLAKKTTVLDGHHASPWSSSSLYIWNQAPSCQYIR